MCTYNYFIDFGANIDEIIDRLDAIKTKNTSSPQDVNFNDSIREAIRNVNMNKAEALFETKFTLQMFSEFYSDDIHVFTGDFPYIRFEAGCFADAFLDMFLEKFAKFPWAKRSPIQIHFVSKDESRSGKIIFRHKDYPRISSRIVAHVHAFGDFVVEKLMYNNVSYYKEDVRNFYLNFNIVYGKEIFAEDKHGEFVKKCRKFPSSFFNMECKKAINNKDIKKCKEMAKSFGEAFVNILIDCYKDDDVPFLQESIGYYKPIWDNPEADENEYEVDHKYDVLASF